ncbi:nuclear transport factor 2 family protein [Maricaulis sp.]|uniref:nuclear transport factor 2 family protein n=1 Tax=Maricaulis sp. TaxID=1486257 RepID=UPI0025BD44CB|nr:nuclear transport factor 2 family protein [Maricaulis sp.]
MKHILAALSVLAIAACTPAPASTDQAAAESTAVAEAIYTAFAAGDVPAFAALLHPEIVWNEAENYPYADNNPYIGPDAVLSGVIGRAVTEWEGFSATPDSMIAQGNRVAVTGRYTGTFLATGEPMDAQFVHIWTVQGGQAIAFQQYADTWQARHASGME